MAVKNQHYVPQSYLKNFAYKQDRIFVFNKFTQKSFISNVSKVASETYFNDFLSDSERVERKQKMEKLFSSLEGIGAKFIRHIQRKVEGIFSLRSLGKAYSINAFTQDQKLDLSCLIAIQALRTRDFRNLLVEISEKSEFIASDIIEVDTLKLIEKFEEKYSVKLNEVQVEQIKSFRYEMGVSIWNLLQTDGMALMQAEFILDHYKKLSGTLLKHIWLIGINDTGQPLYTSDHPVVKHQHKKFNGYSSEGIEIAYPLNDRILIILRERNHFPKYIGLDRKLFPLTFEDIHYYNSLQVFHSNRLVFCSENKFDLARKICQTHPEVGSEKKNRIQVETEHISSE